MPTPKPKEEFDYPQIRSESFEDYCENTKDHLSPSTVADIRTPLHLKRWIDNRSKPTTTTPKTEDWKHKRKYDTGNATHCATFTPDLFPKQWVRILDSELPYPNGDWRQSENRKERDKILQKAKGKNPRALRETEYNNIIGARDSVRRVIKERKLGFILGELDSGGLAEHTFYAIDQVTGQKMKCRPDWVGSNAIITDLKTDSNAGPSLFSKRILDDKLDIVGGGYFDIVRQASGHEMKEYYFIVVEPYPPFAVALYRASVEMLEHGMKRWRNRIEKIDQARRKGEYPGYEIHSDNPDGIITIDLPRWAYNSAEMKW